ncbi:MAG: SDR family NAD(P)-dependent oxidoreductase [Candidatus Zixiibacteriota bacterium]|nr:MAG: SDR family NAD(P)-dependent oxidoreductase [candidate division Zixibacteria bacterium]
MNSFAGKLVLITGASAGIGYQTALDFAARRADLILVARRRERLEELAGKVQQSGGTAEILPCDLAAAEARAELLEDLIRRGRIPDVLINNAGYGNYRPFLEEAPADIFRLMAVNYEAPAHLMRVLIPEMVKRGSGAVVNVSSTAGMVAIPMMAPYCAAKSALRALTEAVAYELAGSGVTVHLVNPGPVDTEFFDAGVWQGRRPGRKAGVRQASQVIREAIINRRTISYVPPRRGLIVYAFNLLGPLGRWAVQRRQSRRCS